MKYILKKSTITVFLLIFFSCNLFESNLKKLSEQEVMKMISENDFDVSKAIYIDCNQEILSEKGYKSLLKTNIGKDFYIDKNNIIKEIRLRKTSDLRDRLIDLSIEFSKIKPVQHYSSQEIDCDNLKEQLEEIFKTDQEVRVSGINMEATDSINKYKSMAIIDKWGIPTKENVGTLAILGLFVAIQHAPTDIIGYYYPKFYVAFSESDKDILALMQDRLLVENGYNQIYGTQRAAIGEFPIEDPENVNSRRASIGMEPL